MVRHANWISTLTIGLALACEASTAQAQRIAKEAVPTLAKSPEITQVADLHGDDEVESNVAELESNVVESNVVESESNDSSEEGSQGEAGIPQTVKVPDSESSGDSSEPSTEIVKERFPDGSVKIERRVMQDEQSNYVNHGEWKMWDERGNLVAQGEYQRGNRVGAWVRWYRVVTEAPLLSKIPYQQFVGPFISQATFKNDQLDGAWTIYDSKMHKISQWSFVDGKRQGPSIWWYANGNKMREVQYRDGELDGPFQEWGPSGSQTVKDAYQGGRKLAAKTAYHAGNVKKTEGLYLFAKEVEQTPDDWWNCKLQVTSKAGHDEKHGTWTSWYTNGKVQLEGNYDHDVQIGQFIWWHANGQKALEGRFDQGKQDGRWVWWHANGQKSIQGEYAKGNPTGRWTWWKEDGKVAQSADLSHTEGVVIDTPRTLDSAAPASPKLSKPVPSQQNRRR